MAFDYKKEYKDLYQPKRMPAIVTVHAAGGRAMMEDAKAAAGINTKVVAVTVLTSLDASDLNEIGVQRGAIVAWLGHNSWDMIATLVACHRLGAVLLPLNWRLAAPELVQILRHAQAAHLLGTPEMEALAGEVLAAGPLHAGPAEGVAPGDLLLVYTSGTTGQPKGALHTAAGMQANAVAAIAAQHLAARDGDNAIVWPAGGSSRVYESRDNKDFAADNIKAVAADDGGRLWVASELGVAILGPGEAKTEWPSGTVPELVGEVEAILVVGAGPATLPGAGPQRKGGLTGKILRGGSPQASVPVELCPSPDMMFTDSPCADSAVKFVTTTDDKGVWTVQEVPLATYGIAVKLDDKWQITLGERLGQGMKEGQVYDTGSLALDR